MKQDRTMLTVAVLAGLVIGWFLGMGWWHVPGRFWGVLLGLGVIIFLVGRSRGGEDEVPAVESEKMEKSEEAGGASSEDRNMDQDVVEQVVDDREDDEVLSPEAAREWLDDLLVEQQGENKKKGPKGDQES